MLTWHHKPITQPLHQPIKQTQPLNSVQHYTERYRDLEASNTWFFVMASAQATVTMSLMSLPSAGLRKTHVLNPVSATTQQTAGRGRVVVRASASSPGKEQVVAGLTSAALAAALLVPEVAEAAQPGISPSLKNFLLSIVAGGVVLTAIFGAVIGVANFDPVKRS